MRIRPILSAPLLAAALSACAPGLAEFWQDYTDDVRAAGLLRPERAPADAPVDAGVLARSFETIGFSFESDPFLTGADTDAPPMIRKWRTPIAYTLVGEAEDLSRLRAVLAPFATELTALTGIPVDEHDPAWTAKKPVRGSPGNARADEDAATGAGATARGPRGGPGTGAGADGPNLLVLYGRDEFLSAVRLYDRLREEGDILPDPRRGDTLAFLGDMIDPWYDAPSPCAGRVYLADGSGGTIEGEVLFAVVMIRTEIPPALLASCVEEEFAQVMGLFDDDAAVRPSVFNDDQEFALLTEHDRLLLRILYDPDLAVGMPPARAMPIVRRLAERLSPPP